MGVNLAPIFRTQTLAVLELYPIKGEPRNDNVRLGFTVANLSEIVKTCETIQTYDRNTGKVYVVQYPDGRKVGLSG